MRIEKNFDLTGFNSFHLQVKANQFVELQNDDDFDSIASVIEKDAGPLYILGGGSNTLFKGDYAGTIVKVSNLGITKIFEGDENVDFHVAAGENWDSFVRFTIAQGLYGIENLIDIPGQVGSSPVQNIGAYGMEASQSILRVHARDLTSGAKLVFENKDCGFGYRESNFKSIWSGRYIISAVDFRLYKYGLLKVDYGDIRKCLAQSGVSEPDIKQLSNCISQIRASKLPSPEVFGNAGSFFKNPIVPKTEAELLKTRFPNIISYPIDNAFTKLAAGWLIDNAGLKNHSVGGAKVHENQALVLINFKDAKPVDVLNLMMFVVESVLLKFGVRLEPEVNIV